MDLDLARIYGTPGQKTASAAQEEQFEKQAQAELFAKLAADNGIDLGTLSDDQIGGLWADTFGQKLAEDDKEHEDKESPDHEKDEKDDKEKKAAYELAELQDEQQKLAFADQAGRVMAHAMVNELNSINENIAKEAAMPEALRKGLDAAGRHAGKAGDRIGKHLEGVGKKVVGVVAKGGEGAMDPRTAKRIGGGVYAAGAAGAAGGAAAIRSHRSKKESSALDDLALQSAFDKAASAGFDTDEAVTRLNAVYALGLGESEKIASAPFGDLNAAVDIRSLEYLEAAGYPVEWTA